MLFETGNQIPNEYWSIFEKSPGGVSLATDPYCMKIFHNAKASSMLRISSGGNFSHSASEPPNVKVYRDGIELSPEEMPMQRSGSQQVEVYEEVLEFVWEDDHRLISVWNASPILNPRGEVCGVLASSEDITKYVLRERQVRTDKTILEKIIDEKVEEDAQLRNEITRLDRLSLVAQMAASISHEVRNPITTVRGFLQLMQQSKSPNHHNYYDLIISELDRANEIIGNFLSLAKHNNPQDCEEQDLLATFQAVMPILEADALMMGKRIKYIPAQVSRLSFNAKEIQQVLINLVRNSLEASEKGACVTITLFESKAQLGFSVKDEGKGIPPHILEQLGTPFLTTKENGTGLGLSICFDIARRHDAEIKIQSDERGSTFHFIFYNSDKP
ncbi:ATP-binding protein [Paenibacillus ferrarius]|uniref:ATP-binding protein n=1 Tax=Paenibacillus ferrarius TaxID=1469647 RepID=UPI003D2A121D